MKSTAAAILAILASTAEASPLSMRDQVCNAAPAGSGSPSPLAKPTVATALACQQACSANSQCKCFVFGLPPNANAPECILYPVPASQVPSQGQDLNVFDLACPAAQIPTTPPTHDQPIGQVPRSLFARAVSCNVAPTATGSKTPIASPVVTTALLCQKECSANSNCQSFCFGLPPAESAPKCLLFNVPAAQVPSQGDDLHIFDLACPAAQVPTTAPTHDEPFGQVPGATGNTGAQTPAQGANTGSNTGAQTPAQGANTGAEGAQSPAQNGGAQLTPRAATCNVAPTATGSKTPLASPVVTSALLCQKQCEAFTNCQSFCFGLPPAESTPKCLLFDVPAAQVPAQGDDLHIFDLACPATQVPSTAPTHDEPIGQVPTTAGNTGAQTPAQGTNNGANTGANTGANNGAQTPAQGAQGGAQGQH